MHVSAGMSVYRYEWQVCVWASKRDFHADHRVITEQ
jgi:hypothetical protein